MTLRPVVRIAIAALLCLVGVGPGIAVAYGPPPAYLVKVTGPSRAVECRQRVPIGVTVLNTDTGKPVKGQFVRWSIGQAGASDAVSPARSKTDARGKAGTELIIGSGAGSRRVVANAGGVLGRTTVKVTCVATTPGPRATPRPTKAPTPEPSGPPLPLERPDLVVGYREDDLAGRAPLLLADAFGLWTDAGLASVTQVAAADPLPGLRDGTLDAAVMPLDAALRAIAAGEPLRILAGYHGYRSDIVAVAAGIDDPADLAGRPVVTGDDDHAGARAAELAGEGWDPAAAGAQIVRPEGGQDAWVAALLDGRVAMAPIRNRDRLAVAQADGSIVLDRQVYGDDVLVATAERVADVPRSLTALLTGTIGAMRELADPATDTDLFAAAEATGTDVRAGVQGGWANDVDDLRPWDGSLGDPAVGGGLGELDAHAAALLGWVPLPADIVAVDLLNAAQDALGMAAAPGLPPVGVLLSSELRVGLPAADLADEAPFLLGEVSGAFAAVGLADVTFLAGAGVAALGDGSVDIAVVPAPDAEAAIASGAAVQVVAGYRSGADVPSVLAVRTDRSDAQIAPVLQALLRGLAALNGPDGYHLALAQAGDTAPVEETAWQGIVASFAPFDGRVAGAESAVHPALAAARASLGLVPPEDS